MVQAAGLAYTSFNISQLWKGLEPPFLHSGLSLMALYQNPEFQEDMALYQNPEFQEDQRNSKFRHEKILGF